MSSEQLYIEDLALGQCFAGKARTVSEEDFTRFAQLTGDAHPIHYDADYASQTRFGKPVAHGLLLMAWTALGATEFSRRLHDSMIALVEQGCRFTAPIFIGDQIYVEYRVDDIEISEKRQSGRVRFAVSMRRSTGEVCLRGFHVYQIRSRVTSCNEQGRSDPR